MTSGKPVPGNSCVIHSYSHLLLVTHTTPSLPFLPPPCPISTTIGPNCNTPASKCDILQPCQNSGMCNNTNTTSNGYLCACSAGFDGIHCENDHRPCKTDICRNQGEHLVVSRMSPISLSMLLGTCHETSNTTFSCACPPGWRGDHCETKVDYCGNVTCSNSGVCRSSLLNFTCECSSDSYSGRLCEVKAGKLAVRQAVSRSFAFVAICALVVVAVFIFVLDVLKYGLGIDPAREDRQRSQRRSGEKQRHPTTFLRFVYVDAPAPMLTTATLREATAFT